MKYTILAYKEEYRLFFENYHKLKNFLIELQADGPYLQAVKANYFEDVSFLNQYIFNQLSTRTDYQRQGHLHILNNFLTGKKITLEIRNNNIYIESADKNNIFFYIVYQNLKNYVIIV